MTNREGRTEDKLPNSGGGNKASVAPELVVRGRPIATASVARGQAHQMA